MVRELLGGWRGEDQVRTTRGMERVRGVVERGVREVRGVLGGWRGER